MAMSRALRLGRANEELDGRAVCVEDYWKRPGRACRKSNAVLFIQHVTFGF